ncbi:MAG: hypothetical protein JEZ14_18805 [Marinilabiliaceae bacterium]|nr:hypothetical protein [Marinilabiliaceae bacterium]
MRSSKVNSMVPAVILDITQSGYDIIRSLHPYKIPLYAFSHKEQCLEHHTKRIRKIIRWESLDDLLAKMIQLAESLDQKPVLIISSDNRLKFVMEHYTMIMKYFLVNLPPVVTLDILLDKTKFRDFALSNDILIPKTLNIYQPEDLTEAQSFNFPVILKPYLKRANWYAAELPKAFIYNTFEELSSGFPAIYKVEQRLILQEYIPGGDEMVFFCMAYFNQSGVCEQSFTGRKIRQWHPLTGTAASLRPCENSVVTKFTKHIYHLLNFTGFGAFEFKYNENNGKYYAIEATAGRLDVNAHAATLGGANLPLAAYCDLTRQRIWPKEKINTNFVFIHEMNEIQTVLFLLNNKQLTLKDLLKSYRGKLYFHYMTFGDFGVSGRMFFQLFQTIGGQVKRYLRRKITFR